MWIKSSKMRIAFTNPPRNNHKRDKQNDRQIERPTHRETERERGASGLGLASCYVFIACYIIATERGGSNDFGYACKAYCTMRTWKVRGKNTNKTLIITIIVFYLVLLPRTVVQRPTDRDLVPIAVLDSQLSGLHHDSLALRRACFSQYLDPR